MEDGGSIEGERERERGKSRKGERKKKKTRKTRGTKNWEEEEEEEEVERKKRRRRGKSLLLWLLLGILRYRYRYGMYWVSLRKIHTRGERGNRGSGSRSRTVIGRAGLAVRGVSGWRRYFRSTSVAGNITGLFPELDIPSSITNRIRMNDGGL